MTEHFAGNVSSSRLLARNAFLELAFDPGPGGGSVIVSARVQDPAFRHVTHDREPGEPDLVTQEASVKITVVSPSGAEVFSRDLPLSQPNVDSPSIGFPLPAPVETGRWRCIIRNTGPSEIACSARLVFSLDTRRLVRTSIATRVLNSAFSQVIDAIGLSVRIDNGSGVVQLNPELSAMLGVDSPNFTFSTPVGNDITMSSLGVKAMSVGGLPALRVLIEFETVGETEISFGVDLADITEATFEVLVVLRSEGGADRRHITPTVSLHANVGVDLTFAGNLAENLLLRPAGSSVEELVDDIIGTLEHAINSPAYLEPVGEYLTEAFVQLAQRGHKFHALEFSGSDFIVAHYDPTADPIGAGGVIDDNPRPADPIDEVLPPRPARSTEFAAGLERLHEEVETIVVLMQENRSLDHMLGYLSLPGGNRENGQPVEGKIDGLAGSERNDAPGDNTTGINALPDTQFPNSPAHELDHVLDQINEGQMSGFLADFMDRYPNVSVADTNPGRHTPLSHYTGELLPTHDALARRHLVCDRWFAAFPGATQPNRFCTLTGSTPVLENLPLPHPDLGYLRQETVFDRLTQARVEWCYFEHDLAFLRFYNRYRLENRRVVPFGDSRDGFVARAHAGTLPPVVFIDPNFVDVPPVRTANDDHPPADVAFGQTLLASVHDTLIRSPQWAKAMLIITYDEHGGFFDHVPPPGTAASPAVIPRVHRNGPRTLGVRVPTFVVSPIVPAGGVSHVRFDHTSIAWTILLRFLGPTATPMSERMARSNHLGMVLDPTVRKEVEPIGPLPKSQRLPRDGAPPDGAVPLLHDDPDLSRDFHEAIRRFGRPIIT
jgi:phospholipase C